MKRKEENDPFFFIATDNAWTIRIVPRVFPQDAP